MSAQQTVMVQQEINEEDLDLILYLLESAQDEADITYNQRGDIIAGPKDTKFRQGFTMFTAEDIVNLWIKLSQVEERLINKVNKQHDVRSAIIDAEFIGELP